jgi:pyruvate kinase
MAHETTSGALAVYTNTGRTAHLLSRFRPNTPILVLTPQEKIYDQLALSFGCYPILVKQPKSLLAFGDLARQTLLDRKMVKKGQTIILITGLPLNKVHHQANMILTETA